MTPQSRIDREDWIATVTAARDEGFAFFDFLTAVDLGEEGFEVVVHVYDPSTKSERLLSTTCPRDQARVPSLIGVFGGAGWHERAAAELFGIDFEGHEARHLLLPESFEAHPLRKDFVLAAREARAWPGVKEPGESDADVVERPRRRMRPPGAAPPGWGQA